VGSIRGVFSPRAAITGECLASPRIVPRRAVLVRAEKAR
jgi:hypothetical protein